VNSNPNSHKIRRVLKRFQKNSNPLNYSKSSMSSIASEISLAILKAYSYSNLITNLKKKMLTPLFTSSLSLLIYLLSSSIKFITISLESFDVAAYVFLAVLVSISFGSMIFVAALALEFSVSYF